MRVSGRISGQRECGPVDDGGGVDGGGHVDEGAGQDVGDVELVAVTHKDTAMREFPVEDAGVGLPWRSGVVGRI